MAAATQATAARLLRSLQVQNELLHKATVATQSVHATPSDPDPLLLERLLSELDTVVRDIDHNAPATIRDWPYLARESPSAANVLAANLLSANTLFVLSLARLISVSVPALQLLDASIVTPAGRRQRLQRRQQPMQRTDADRMRMFSGVWNVMYTACDQFNPLVDYLHSPIPGAVDLTAMQPALNQLMAWLLTFVRQGGSVHELLPAFVRQDLLWQKSILGTLTKPLIFLLDSLRFIPCPAGMCTAVSALAPGLIATFCCLACELDPRCSKPRPRPGHALDARIAEYAESLSAVQQLLSLFMSTCNQVSLPLQHNPELLSPAALELFKRLVTACQKTPGNPGGHALAALVSFVYMVGQSSGSMLCGTSQTTILNTPPEQHASAAGPASSSISSTATVNLVPRFLTPDIELVSALSHWPSGDATSFVTSNLAINVVLTKRLHYLSSKHLVLDGPTADGLVQALRNCSSLMRRSLLLLQRQQQQQQQRGKHVAGRRSSQAVITLSASDREVLQLQLPIAMDLYNSGVPVADDMRIEPLTDQQRFQLEQLWLSPAWATLSAWQRLPGSTAVLELMVREQGSADTTIDTGVCNAVRAACHNIAAQAAQPNLTPASLAACISMVASVHKLLLLDAGPTGPGQNSTGQQGNDDKQQLGETLRRVQQQHLRPALFSVLAHAQQHQGGNDTSLVVPSAAYSRRQMHQLRSLLVMVLVWVGHMRVRGVTHQSGADYICNIGPGCALSTLSKVEESDPELAEVARELALPAQPSLWKTKPAAFKQEAAAWDTFALRHFHGRLLPGCSYLRCTNVSGISEAALPTQLCGGCRRVRYCSVTCQRDAWRMEGHSELCGQGNWAPV